MRANDAGLGVDLDAFRGYLVVLARSQIGPRLRGKVDPMDLVQLTLMKAHQRREGFRGDADRELRGWLRSILRNVIIDHLRKFGGPDGMDWERSLEADLEQSSRNLERLLADGGSSPSHKASRNERLAMLADGLQRLPEDQRRAIELRHLRGETLERIAETMGRTPASVAGLLRRGLQALRDGLGDLS